MAITNKGKKWEIINSLWVLFSFVILLNYIGFFWAGIKGRNKKWSLFGCVYLFFGFGVPMLSVDKLIAGIPYLSNALIMIWFVFWIFSIVHSFMVRKEFLIRREIIVNNAEKERNHLRKEIETSSGASLPAAESKQMREDVALKSSNTEKMQEKISASQSGEQQLQKTEMQQETLRKVDLNQSTEEDLITLPGVGIAAAKKAIIMREKIGGFISVDDFIQRLELMPHFAVQIEKMAEVSFEKKTTEEKRRGRVLDI